MMMLGTCMVTFFTAQAEKGTKQGRGRGVLPRPGNNLCRSLGLEFSLCRDKALAARAMSERDIYRVTRSEIQRVPVESSMTFLQ